MQLSIRWHKLSSELGWRLGLKVGFKKLRLEPKFLNRGLRRNRSSSWFGGRNNRRVRSYIWPNLGYYNNTLKFLNFSNLKTEYQYNKHYFWFQFWISSKLSNRNDTHKLVKKRSFQLTASLCLLVNLLFEKAWIENSSSLYWYERRPLYGICLECSF